MRRLDLEDALFQEEAIQERNLRIYVELGPNSPGGLSAPTCSNFIWFIWTRNQAKPKPYITKEFQHVVRCLVKPKFVCLFFKYPSLRAYTEAQWKLSWLCREGPQTNLQLRQKKIPAWNLGESLTVCVNSAELAELRVWLSRRQFPIFLWKSP